MKKTNAIILGSVITGCAVAYASHHENYALQLTKYNIRHRNLPASFQGYRVLQVSDLHNTLFGKNQRHLMKKVKEANPDCIVITGDIIDKRRTRRDNLFPLQKAVSYMVSCCPVYYVPGNHEATSSLYPYVRSFLSTIGVQVLENQMMRVRRNDDVIHICGIMDPKFYPAFSNQFYYQLRRLAYEAGQKFTILLAHHPEHFEDYAGNFDLVYCGHAHGGQFRIPGVGGIYAPNQGFFPRYSEGIFVKCDTTMVVSRGLGNSRMPQRILNRPQLVLTTLYTV